MTDSSIAASASGTFRLGGDPRETANLLRQALLLWPRLGDLWGGQTKIHGECE